MVRDSPLAFPLRKAWDNRPPGKPWPPRLFKPVERRHGNKVHWRPNWFLVNDCRKMPVEVSPSESVYVLHDDPSILKAIGRLLATEGIMVRAFSDPADSFVQTHSVPVAI